MKGPQQTNEPEFIDTKHFWGLGKLLSISCLFQIGLFFWLGLWGVLYLAIFALITMWVCTHYCVAEQPDDSPLKTADVDACSLTARK